MCFVDSGRIENGTLIGNGTKVMAQQNVVFSDNILLKGSWKADTAYSIWFDFKSDCVVDSSGRFISGSDNSQQMNNILLFVIYSLTVVFTTLNMLIFSYILI